MAAEAFGEPGAVTTDELRLAARNHGLPLEALRYAVTPIGLHYLLTHFDIPDLHESTWRLDIEGQRTLTLTMGELRRRPHTTVPVTLECAGNGRAWLEPRPISQPWLDGAVGTAEWTGTALAPLLEEAGLSSDTVEILFTGHDRGVQGGVEQAYQRSLPVAEVLSGDPLLAWGINGQPLPPQHGYPLRLIVPGWYGMTHVKWLQRITALTTPFEGYQQTDAYWFRSSDEDAGWPVTRIEPRALMVPPGVPEFETRRRVVAQGHHLLQGKAWSGWGRITSVEVSCDGGGSWREATLAEAAGPWAWTSWTFDWDASPGPAVLCARACDSTGRCQPTAVPWSTQGMANNAVQRVQVEVQPGG